MCIFCDIVKGDSPSYKIYENEDSYAFLSIADEACGHTLVIPKKHYENVMDIPQKEYNSVMETIKKVSEHYTQNCGYTGVNIMNASGKDAQQSVFHLHFHILPRKENDGLDTWPKLDKANSDFKKVCQELSFED